MAEYFPALKHCLKRHITPYLPPHPLRTVAGSLCAALLTWCVWQGCTLVWHGCASVCSAVSELFSGDASDADSASQGESAALTNPERQAMQKRKTRPEETRGNVLPWSLPHSDKYSSSLSGKIKEVDDTLIQSLRWIGLDTTRVATLQTTPPEKLFSPKNESYSLQRAHVFLPETPEEFAETVRAGLKAQANGTRCTLDEACGRFVLRVHSNTTLTHELFLFRTGEAFMPPPASEYPKLSILILNAERNVDTAKQWLAVDLPLAFALSPAEPNAAEVAKLVQESGQEVLLSQPVSSNTREAFSTNGIVQPNMSPELVRDAICHNLCLLPQSVGIITQGDPDFTTDEQASSVFASASAENGLFLVDTLTSPNSTLHAVASTLGIRSLRMDSSLDGDTATDDVLHNLRQADKMASRNGQFLVIAHARPETLQALEEWALERDGDVAVVPLRYQSTFERQP